VPVNFVRNKPKKEEFFMKTISLDELYEKSKNLGKDDVILDVRGPSEFSQGHIKGGLNISHDSVVDHVEKLKGYKNIYIHCQMGGRAKMAYTMLTESGFSNLQVCVEAGFRAWGEKGYPVDKD
jgi:rhodanese-related sulfurtransferase